MVGKLTREVNRGRDVPREMPELPVPGWGTQSRPLAYLTGRLAARLEVIAPHPRSRLCQRPGDRPATRIRSPVTPSEGARCLRPAAEGSLFV